MNKQKVTAIIASAGKGTRAGLKENKIFANLDGESVILKTVKTFNENAKIDEIIIVHSLGEKDKINDILYPYINKPIKYVLGGSTRFESIKNALNEVNDGIVIIHDAVRPYLSSQTLNNVIKTALINGTAVVGSNSTDTILELDLKGDIISSSRKDKRLAKTPQAFDVIKLKKAYALAGDGEGFTDDAGVYCSFIGKCKFVEDDNENKKLTYPQDFNGNATRVGTGFDLHVLVENRKLILGGVEIPFNKGLLGHSDADVLTHSIMDALLSSAGLRDIGYYFSDKDEKYKDISSIILLKEVLKMLDDKKVKPAYISAVIMAEKPKLLHYIPKIIENLACITGLSTSQIGITATTLEGIGIVGREEGIACQSYVLCTDIKG